MGSPCLLGAEHCECRTPSSCECRNPSLPSAGLVDDSTRLAHVCPPSGLSIEQPWATTLPPASSSGRATLSERVAAGVLSACSA